MRRAVLLAALLLPARPDRADTSRSPAVVGSTRKRRPASMRQAKTSWTTSISANPQRSDRHQLESRLCRSLMSWQNGPIIMLVITGASAPFGVNSQ